MDDTPKMFQKIINGQSSMKSELLGEIKKVNGKVDKLAKETRQGFEKVNQRISTNLVNHLHISRTTPQLEMNLMN